MAFGLGGGKYAEEQIQCLTYLIFFFNFVFWILGAVVFSLALWIRFDKDLQDYIFAIGMEHYWTGIYILLFVGVVVMLVAMFGCCGVINGSVCMLGTFIALLAGCFVLEMAGAAYTLNNGLYRSAIYPWLQNQFRHHIWKYESDKQARYVMSLIQEYIGCCGADGSSDYDDIHVQIPSECRDKVTGNEWPDSCSEKFSWFLEQKSGWVSGLAIFMAFFQLLVMVFTICLCRAVKKDQSE